MNNRHTKGFVLIEAILAGTLLVLVISTFVIAAISGQESAALSGKRNRAILLAQEGIEATRNIRDEGFANLGDGTHGLAIIGNQWAFSGAQDITDTFTRQITVTQADENSKDIASTVTWQQNAQRPGTVTLTTRLANWMASIISWLNPFKESSLDLAGSEDGIKVQSSGNYAYVVRANGSPDFVVVDVSNSANPTIAASLTLDGNPKNIAISGSYAYIATTHDTKELQIIDISMPTSPTVVGIFNAASGADARGVTAVNSTVYLVRESSSADEFIIINATNPASPTLVGSLNLGATGYEVATVDNYAYIASGHNSQEVQIVNITTPSTPALIGSFDLPGNTDALTITAFGSTALTGQGNTLHILNVANPAAPAILGSTNLSGQANDLSLGNANTLVFAATAAGNAEFVVVDITDLTNSSIIGTVNISGNSTINGVAYDAGHNKTYGVTNLNTEEFMVFAAP